MSKITVAHEYSGAHTAAPFDELLAVMQLVYYKVSRSVLPWDGVDVAMGFRAILGFEQVSGQVISAWPAFKGLLVRYDGDLPEDVVEFQKYREPVGRIRNVS